MIPLKPGGLDAFYADESERHPLSCVAVVRIPFLRLHDSNWHLVWPDFLDAAATWRRGLSARHNIRFKEELHAYKILKCQGLYKKTHRNLTPEEASDLYKDCLESLTFLPDRSIMTVFANENSRLSGETGVAAAFTGLFQRMRTQCERENVNGIMFFDDGHDEYIRQFRRAQKYLPTGSSHGGWGGGVVTRNLPLDMFPKDANLKKSSLSYFLQIADLVGYAARLKIEHESGSLTTKRERRGHHLLYDCIPTAKINLRATRYRADGIVPI